MTNALSLRNLYKSFGPTEIIRDVTLTIPHGERHAIIGPNGAGKSTLFNLISGLHRPSRGTILMNEKRIDRLPPHTIAQRGLSRSFQVTNILPSLSVYENLRCAALRLYGGGLTFWRGVGGISGLSDHVNEILDRVGLADQTETSAGVLSHFDQRMLELAITLASNPNVILLDEPTAGLSREETERAVDIIRHSTSGRTLLIVEHDMDVVFGLSDRISVLVYGAIIATGTPREIRANPDVQNAYLGEAMTP